ncbi:Ribosomal RNA small subunit methyltransferase, chloroplastic [Sesamum alatum]|uniref:rRNA adenine N(6)-methyltransferase n=1 Tax=Sesamum alatum TaxID=300844 RepID=A0AAE2CE36_9LAMI|nr:Ribosomal RNA small subunit methyltransferase, chloroplastic [Sesamum alatum]
MRMSSLLHSVPPSLLFPHVSSTSTSPPPHDGLAATATGKLPNATLRVQASTTSKRKPRRQEDDYHSTLKALNSKGRFPRKSLGQHYMLNGSVNEELVAAANVKEGDIVLEIGPGTGSLTNVLVNAGATVLAIEKDPHMAALVRERFAGLDRVKVVEEDFTRSHIHSHMSSILPSKSPPDGNSCSAKVVANIPFNISTDVVKQLLPMGDIFSEVILLLQDEAALRLADSSLRSSEYRPINIFVNFYSDPEYLLKVSRTNFFPQPKVDAAVVAFKLKQTVDYPRVSSIKSFFSMVNSAFNGKRKMMRKSLQHMCPSPDIEAALCAAGLPPTSRPEELTLQDFVMLHNLIVKT